MGFAARFLEPKSSYEYQASVQTSDYNNFVAVRSEDPALPLPNSVFYKEQPILKEFVRAPIPAPLLVKTEPKLELVSAPAPESVHVKTAEPKVELVNNHHAVLVEPTPINYVHAVPALQPVFRTIVKSQPIVKHIHAQYLPAEPIQTGKCSNYNNFSSFTKPI